jgi:hypothetical protein
VAVNVLTETVINLPGTAVAYAADPSHAPQWYADIESVALSRRSSPGETFSEQGLFGGVGG